MLWSLVSGACGDVLYRAVAMLRQELYEWIKVNGGVTGVCKVDNLITAIKEKLNRDIPSEIIHEVEQQVHWFIVEVKKRWKQTARKEKVFLSRNKKWLSEPFSSHIRSLSNTPAPSSVRGRPVLPFSAKKRESMRMDTSRIVTKNAADKLLHAAKRRARSEGRNDLAYVIKETTATPTRPTKFRRLLRSHSTPPRLYDRQQALALFVERRDTKERWQLSREAAKDQGANIYPSYHEITAAKKECWPEGIDVQPTKAEVPLQSLLEHTAERIIDLQKTVIEQVAGKFHSVCLNIDTKQ